MDSFSFNRDAPPYWGSAETRWKAVLIGFSLLSVLYIGRLYVAYIRAIQSLGGLPGTRTLFCEELLINRFLPAIPGIFMSTDYPWTLKFEEYRRTGWDIFSMIGVWPPGSASLCIADAGVIKEITSSRHRFPKSYFLYSVLNVFGKNIVTTEFDEWKRFRKLASPAFSERNTRLVYEETVKTITDLLENVWGNKDRVELDNIVNLTFQITLSVLSGAAFGHPMRISEEDVEEDPEKPSFKRSLHIVAHDIWMKIVLPRWAMGFTKRLRTARAAFDQIENTMLKRIADRRQYGKKEDLSDLFGLLLDASDDSRHDGTAELTEEEFMGNLFVFLIGGQETAGHTMCFILASLALYQDEQEKLYEQTKTVLPDGRVPAYNDLPKLTRALAVANETLRKFPPNVLLPKYSVKDTFFTTTNTQGETRHIPVPANTKLLLHVAGLHYNPRYWPEPEEWRPERFMGDYPKDAFMPYNLGARACLGRRFFEAEVVTVLTLLIQRYKIFIRDDPQYAAEPLAEKRARILSARNILTLTPGKISLILERR